MRRDRGRDPWALPRRVYSLTIYAPWRVYFHLGDRLLFMIWGRTLPFQNWLEDRLLAERGATEVAGRRILRSRIARFRGR